MTELCLMQRLWNAEEAARANGDAQLAELLDEAAGALDIALSIADRFDDHQARRFVDAHSEPAPPSDMDLSPEANKARQAAMVARAERAFSDARWQRRLTMLLDAARFVDGRDVVPVDELLVAIAHNDPAPDMTEPDRVMAAARYERVGNVYRKLHNGDSRTDRAGR